MLLAFFLSIVSYALSCIRTCYASFSALLSMYMSFEPSCFIIIISLPLIPRLLFVSFLHPLPLMYIFLSYLSVNHRFHPFHNCAYQSPSNISYLILQASNPTHCLRGDIWGYAGVLQHDVKLHYTNQPTILIHDVSVITHCTYLMLSLV